MPDEFAKVEVFPLQTFRFHSNESEPNILLLQLISSREGEADVVHSYTLSTVQLKIFGKHCLAESEKLERGRQVCIPRC